MRLRLGSRTATGLIAGLVALAVVAACGSEQAGGSGQGDGSRQPATSRSSAIAGAEKLAPCPSTPSKPPASKGLPDVSLPCLGNGPDIRLADLRGPLVVNVWAQWCPPCRDEAPYLAALAKTGKVRMLGIDYADPRPELAVEFATGNGLTYPHVADPEKAVQQALRVGGPPLTAFVDKDGALVHVHRGVLTSQQQLDQLVRDKLGVAL